MKRFRPIVLLITTAMFCCSSVLAEKLKYEVLLFGKKIGETTVEVRDSAGGKYYKLRSNTQVKMLFVDKRSSMSTDVVFHKDGTLASSFFKNVKEDGIILTQAVSENTKVQVSKNGEKSTIPNPINYTSVLMYFAEPSNMRRVFSERLGVFFDLSKMSDGRYFAEMTGGSAVYTYKNGKLSELEMKSTLGSVYMRLVN